MLQLIALCEYVCQGYDTRPDLHTHRRSNKYCPDFTVQELMTIYLFGLIEQGYCATKKLNYHGLKLHLIALDRLHHMPLPARMQFTKASVNDLTALRAELAYLPP